ncbi:hypothetical protein INR49_022363 [Caranx melampygus]|nr:hypothetical protein INR49_022363 [Caranx melampygus]
MTYSDYCFVNQPACKANEVKLYMRSLSLHGVPSRKYWTGAETAEIEEKVVLYAATSQRAAMEDDPWHYILRRVKEQAQLCHPPPLTSPQCHTTLSFPRCAKPMEIAHPPR